MKRAPLVGRHGERADLEAVLAGCREGAGGLVLVSGDAGVGKSRLVSEVLDGWDGNILRGASTMGDSAYAPVVEVLRDVSDRFGDEVLADHARVLLPELAMPWRDIDRDGLIAAICRTVRDVARRQPTVVLLEDLHWASAAAIELLPALTASTAREPLLLLATYRSEELPRAHPVRGLRAELRRRGLLVELALGPLSGTETGELLAELLGGTPSPALAAAVHDRAEGLPFFVEELTAALVETDGVVRRNGEVELARGTGLPVPDSVMDAVLVRTAPLRRQATRAVELAAVLGVRVDLPALARLVEPGDIDRLLEAGLLREDTADAAVFRHALVRDALYRAIPWARRRSHHRLVAEHLATHGALPEVVAEHWIGANEPERARPLLLAAAERCCAVHAYRDAAALARRALAVWPEATDPAGRLDTLERLADCAELCGELKDAAAVWTEVAALRRGEGDLASAGAAHRRLANTAELLGDWSGAVTARTAAAEAFAAAAAPADAAAERLVLAEQLASAAHPTRALAHAVAAGEDADAGGRVDLKAHALALQGAIRAELGDVRHGVELARSGLELALAGQLAEAAAASQYELAGALISAADYAAAADAYASASELCRRHGLSELAHGCLACMAVAVRFLGDWDRALVIAGDVLDDDEAPEEVRMVAEEEVGLIAALRGDRRRARGPLRRATALGRTHEIFGVEVGATWGLAVIAQLDGDDTEATRVVSSLLERCATKEASYFAALPALRWVATHLAVRGDRNQLVHCHRLLATAATQNSSPKVLSALAHAGAELALTERDQAQAAAQFGRSVELLHGITAPFEHALSLLRWGTALAEVDERHVAVEAVTSAYRTAHQLGAKPLARSCAAQLADMGEQVDRRLGRLAARALSPAGLTRREQEVLRLLATGKTNRQIAGDLFISARTVDMHVRNVLRKLDSSSRLAAVRRASELGLL